MSLHEIGTVSLATWRVRRTRERTNEICNR